MGRASETGGVWGQGDRIVFDLRFQGKRIKPTWELKPTEANLKAARRQRERMVKEIRDGVFDLAADFPGYKFVYKHIPKIAADADSFADVRDRFLRWVAGYQEHSSVVSLRRKLTSYWTPRFGERDIKSITFVELSDFVSERDWGSPKTYNNYVSALREMYAYAVDHGIVPDNPAARLKSKRLQPEEADPYSVFEAQELIRVARRIHGELDALYWELSFLLGLRPGEQIAVLWSDFSRLTNKLTVRRSRTEGEDKKRTKTYRARHMSLPPRAVEVLQALRALTQMKKHGHIFEDRETGAPIEASTVMSDRWAALHRLAGVRHRSPYQCRHSSVSWKLMLGQNPYKVATFHGHSVATMLKTYAHWIEAECEETEVARMRSFHGFVSSLSVDQTAS